MLLKRLSLLFVGCHALLAATGAIGAEYPVRPIRIVVPFTPGGGTDIIARALGQHLSSAFGQNVIVDNRPGGNTVIASEIVARARPDGVGASSRTTAPSPCATSARSTACPVTPSPRTTWSVNPGRRC